MITTFDEARKEQLARIDEAWAAVRKLLDEKTFCNPVWGDFTDAKKSLNDEITELLSLNSTILDIEKKSRERDAKKV